MRAPHNRSGKTTKHGRRGGGSHPSYADQKGLWNLRERTLRPPSEAKAQQESMGIKEETRRCHKARTDRQVEDRKKRPHPEREATWAAQRSEYAAPKQ